MDRRRVQATFDQIAEHFAETRRHPWPEVEAFVERFGGGAVGVDIGCANGRHADLLAGTCDRVVGIDVSRELLAVGRRGGRPQEPILGDATAVPLASGVVDTALYVATIHHLPSRSRRLASLAELARVLAPGAEALVSTWSTAADRFDADESVDIELPWELPSGETVDRYYHIYAPADFEADLAASPLEVSNCRVSSGNVYARVRCPEEQRT